jgi:hypothetical protein
MGTPRSNTSGEMRGASASYTDDGPPDSTMPAGCIARMRSSGRLNGWISQ